MWINKWKCEIRSQMDIKINIYSYAPTFNSFPSGVNVNMEANPLYPPSTTISSFSISNVIPERVNISFNISKSLFIF